MTNTSESLASETAVPDLRYVGFWIRVGASVVDWLILIPLTIATFFVTDPKIYLLIAIVSVLYKPVFEGLFSASPAKMLLGLKVVNKELGNIGFVSAFIRDLVLVLYAFQLTIYSMKALVGDVKNLPQEDQLAFLVENKMVLIMGGVLFLGTIISVLFVAFKARSVAFTTCSPTPSWSLRNRFRTAKAFICRQNATRRKTHCAGG